MATRGVLSSLLPLSSYAHDVLLVYVREVPGPGGRTSLGLSLGMRSCRDLKEESDALMRVSMGGAVDAYHPGPAPPVMHLQPSVDGPFLWRLEHGLMFDRRGGSKARWALPGVSGSMVFLFSRRPNRSVLPTTKVLLTCSGEGA